MLGEGTYMSIRISTGVSLGAIRSLREAERNIARSSARLASGRRINSAADDPAGLAVSERYRADIASLNRVQFNVQDGISLAQTAQGGLSEVATLLSEARALAIQSSSGSLSNSEREDLDVQFQSILSDIDAISSATAFGSFNPLSDDNLEVVIAAGVDPNDTITVNGVDSSIDALNLSGSEIDRQGDAQDAIDDLDDAISDVSNLAANFGITENRLESRSRLIGVQLEATSAAESRIADTDYALESAILTKNQILQESAIAVLGQANSSMGLVLRLLE